MHSLKDSCGLNIPPPITHSTTTTPPFFFWCGSADDGCVGYLNEVYEEILNLLTVRRGQ